MSSMYILLLSLLLFSAQHAMAASPASLSASNKAPRTIDWTELMPEEDLQLLMNMPRVEHENLSNDEFMDSISLSARNTSSKSQANNSQKNQTPPALKNRSDSSALEDQVTNAIGQSMQQPTAGKRSWQDALVSTRVRPEFNNKKIRLAGYIVPLDYNEEEVIDSFFLVPYFGACIHVPPPPPNQIIYVRYPKGLTLENLYTPFWVSGTLKIETVENDMGLSSYSMSVDTLVQFKENELVD